MCICALVTQNAANSTNGWERRHGEKKALAKEMELRENVSENVHFEDDQRFMHIEKKRIAKTAIERFMYRKSHK